MTHHWRTVLIGLALIALAGCATTPGPGPEADGGLAVSVAWPEVTAELIPSGTQSIAVEVTNAADGSPVGSLLLTQTEPSGSLTGILGGTEVTVAATARPNADGTGTPLAAATTQATIPSGDTASVSLALASTIAEIVVTPASPALDVLEQVSLSAEARDGDGGTVLVASGFDWTSDSTAVASVDSSGQVTAHAPGTAVITATEAESGATATADVSVGLASVSLSRTGRIGEPGHTHIASVSGIDVDSSGNVLLLSSASRTVNIYSAKGNPIDRVPLPSSALPSDVAFGPDGLIYVLAGGVDFVHGIDRDGTVHETVSQTNDPDSQFAGFGGMTFDGAGRLHITDPLLDTVRVFDPQGGFVDTYGTSGFGLGELLTPEDIALGPASKIYVLEETGQRVHRFTEAGVAETNWGGITFPTSIAADDAVVVVAEEGGPALIAFDGAGVDQWTNTGTRYSHLAASDDGRVYGVTDYDRVKVVRTSDGEDLDEWGVPVGTPGHLADVEGVVVDSQGRVFVADRSRQTLSLFEPGGGPPTEVTVADSLGTGPTGICMGSGGNLYVTTRRGVMTFTPDLALVDQWEDPDGAAYLTDVVMGPDGDLYVSDRTNAVIKVFATDGTLVDSFGAVGFGVGEMISPWDLALDASGALYVADAGNDKILHYDPDGVYAYEWGTQGDGPGEFRQPSGVDVDHRGLVYVTDSRDRSLQIFTSDGSFVSEAPVEDEFGPLLPNDVAIHPDGSQAVVAAPEDVLVYALTN
ncbi:MAG: hypothetical protein GF320_08225 [Armatimonadia bacterium]|nr:hypothetical protein [Armatimonadia bacterium]